METRANHIWVGAVTLLLLLAAAAFFVVLARLGENNNKQFDIFFEQSVGGVSEGSTVTYSGVPVGTVSDISIWEQDPEFVKVRIEVESDTPVLVGTVASVSASFTGVSNISLGGGRSNQPPISCDTTDCRDGVPVIPTAPGAIGEILASAPLLLERLATLSERLTRVVDDRNQASIAGILANTDKMSGELAASAPQVRAALTELQTTLAQSTRTLAAFEGTLQSADALIQTDGRAVVADLRSTLGTAQVAAAQLQATLAGVDPVAQQLQRDTLPVIGATMQDLRRTSEALRAVTQRLETEGAGALVSGPQLPDYEP